MVCVYPNFQLRHLIFAFAFTLFFQTGNWALAQENVSDPPSERAPMTLPDTDRWTTETEVPWSFTYKPYEEVLRNFVDDKGLVDYVGLLANRGALDRFLVGVSRLEMSTYRLWSMREQEAFWINLYNALLLKVATDFYPIAPEPFDPEYPRDSIRQTGRCFYKRVQLKYLVAQ